MSKSRWFLVAVALSGCGIECCDPRDQQRAECVSKYGPDNVVTCYSEGKPVLRERTRGEVGHGQSGYILFVSARTGRAMTAQGMCSVENAAAVEP